MNKKIFASVLIAGLSAGGAGAQTPKPAAKKMAPAAHVILTPGDLKWGPGLDFIYGDQRCDTFTSFDDCAFEFSIRHLKCAES